MYFVLGVGQKKVMSVSPKCNIGKTSNRCSTCNRFITSEGICTSCSTGGTNPIIKKQKRIIVAEEEEELWKMFRDEQKKKQLKMEVDKQQELWQNFIKNRLIKSEQEFVFVKDVEKQFNHILNEQNVACLKLNIEELKKQNFDLQRKRACSYCLPNTTCLKPEKHKAIHKMKYVIKHHTLSLDIA